jgi:two-component system LytT family response regulator
LCSRDERIAFLSALEPSRRNQNASFNVYCRDDRSPNRRIPVSKIRTLVVEDEPMARDRVRSLLQQQPDIEIVGECGDGAQAVSAIERLDPELVFLDVQIPVVDGFGVIRAVPPERMPMVVFTTAYDEYALRAFEVHALDYLLKPFDRTRFMRALDRVRERRERQRAGDLGRRLLAMVQDLKPEVAPAPERIVVKSGGRIFFIRVDEIDWIDAAGNYVRLHVKGESHLFRETMSAIEKRLEKAQFVRIHRSHLVNADRIRELLPGNGEHVVVLRNGIRLPLSRGYRDRLQERMNTCSVEL